MYFSPVVLDDALQALANGARVMAGATDLLPANGEKPLQGDFVDVGRIAALRGISFDGDFIRIGGAATWSEITRAQLPPAFSALREAAREIGAVQIQNRATVAGNLCNASPAADGVPPLLILDAQAELVSRRGARRIPLSQFLLGVRRTALAHDELMTAVVCPRPPETLRSTFLKLGSRRYLVISIAMVAVALDIAGDEIREARIAVGACSASAMRLPEAEARLVGAPAKPGLSDRLALADFGALKPIDDVRADAAYRREAAWRLTQRAVESCLMGEAGGAV